MRHKKYRGFTLYESIIAIGFLSICSVIILQFFIFSNEVNNKARNIDISDNIVTNSIEKVRGLNSSEEIFNGKSIYANSTIDISKNNELSILAYYDKDFNLLPNRLNNQGEIIIPKNARFILSQSLKYSDYQGQYVIESFSDDGNIENSPYNGSIFTFNAKINEYNYDTNEIGDELSNLSTSKYLVN